MFLSGLCCFMEKNKEVYLNFGLIAYGSLREIEKLQRIINSDFQGLKIVYQTVTAKRLFLQRKSRLEDGIQNEREKEKSER